MYQNPLSAYSEPIDLNACRGTLSDVTDRVLEELESWHRLTKESITLPGPLRVLGGGDVALGVRHQAEDYAGRVADASDIVV